jgi:hypothetical protein
MCRCYWPACPAKPAARIRTLRAVSDASSIPRHPDLVALGLWPRLAAQILRARLETAGIDVMVEWSADTTNATGTLLVPIEHHEFAAAVVHEIDVDDEVPDTSPHAYLVRIEEHLAAAAGLLDELRTRLNELEADAAR